MSLQRYVCTTLRMLLEALSLRPSGRAVLWEHEIERLIADSVDLKFYDGRGGIEAALAEKYENGRLVLTSHRLLWLDAATAPQPGTSCWMPLAAVHTWEAVSSVASRFSLRSEKIKVSLYVTFDRKPAPGASFRALVGSLSGGAVEGIDGVRMGQIGMGFRNGIPTLLPEQLTKALEEKLWKRNAPPVAAEAAPMETPLPDGIHPHYLQQLVAMGFSRNRAVRALIATGNRSVPDAMDWAIAFQADPSADDPLPEAAPDHAPVRAGLGDILKREREKQRKTGQALDDAFQDLNSLMSKAEDMVKLADRFYSSFSKTPSTEDDAAADEDTIRELISMGITSPVTKESAGSLYHDQLSRQLADFLEERIVRHGGVMTLLDVYSLYNRARGAAELVSPDDLMKAAQLLEKLRLPFKVRTYQSGVRVIQSAAHDEDAICSAISQLVDCQAGTLSRPLTAVDVAGTLRVPLTIAQEHLFLAERHAVVCRDDGPEGLRFYANFFPYM